MEPAAEEEQAAERVATAETPAPEKAAADAPASAPPGRPAESGGILSYLLYGLGALVLAILAFLFVRRRGGEEEAAGEVERTAQASSSDVFADVELKDEELEVATVEPAASEAEAPLDLEADEGHDSRGYGERKHDEYAADVDAGDALAEADIYVAYGRYPQAVDLLKNAAVSEPGNPAYKVKLMEIYGEMNDRDGVMEQLAALEKLGDAEALSRAEEVLSVMQGRSASETVTAPPPPREPAPEPPAAEREPPTVAAEPEPALESDFGELEIEETPAATGLSDDLDLSVDFAPEEQSPRQDEDLVIAAEANGMSTKLDLARAYLDMGDEDGARQILEEVLAEGQDELKAEARALLERID
jgi:pilus assembly protein FimV